MLKVITLFTGIGAQEAALKRLGLDFEIVGISEIDKYAIQSYEAINGSVRNYGDITQIERLDYADLWTYSFPCQDLSFAGKQRGISEETRSGLLLHVKRLLTESVLYGTQPKYLLLENVKALVSKKFMPDFQRWLDKLEQLGYNNYWQILNAKDYGIPQNRERVFVISIRKDVDTKGYKFPRPVPLKKRLKDMLEPWVDVKYYLSDDKVVKFLQNDNVCQYLCTWCNCNTLTTNKGEGLKIKEPLCAASRGRNPENPSDRTAGIPTEQTLEINYTGCSNTLTSVQKDNYVIEPKVINPLKGKTDYGWHFEQEVYDENGIARAVKAGGGSGNIPKIIQVGNIVDTGNWDNPQRGRIYSPEGCAPALNHVGSGGLEPKIIIGSTQKNAYIGSVENYSPSLTAAMGMGGKQIPMLLNGYCIRKLTPRECWRLMGFTDIEFECAKLSGVSNSQLYKQAGNSIVVNVLVGIFKGLFDDRF